MKVLTFFNNKGGVGKTTLSANIAAYLELELKKKVLVIDADPQSNTTQLMLDDNQLEKVYTKPQFTIYNYLQPLEMGESSINTGLQVFPAEENNYGVSLIPGHPRLSFIEDRLSEGWQKCNHDIGGLRVTNWVAGLKQRFAGQYEYIIFDVGPALSALNRSILLNSDFFIAPMGCDIFSLIGIENISEWIKLWKDLYEDALKSLKRRHPEFDFKQYHINDNIDNNFRFIGFSVQQYTTKVISGERRPINAYERIITKIPDSLEQYMSFLKPTILTMEDCNLGGIPNYFSLVPLSQTSKRPIHQLTKSDGVVGNQYAMVRNYKNLMHEICSKILKNIDIAGEQ
ncbi:Cellulose biosynthesis protein BcsQ [Pelosinus fermentans]|uniref:Cobyrinic acid ac-diamide synthase n=1 Tax=Pelosinus fermentans B4 TaxID=1149862 RepID=I8RLQ7_9FIRM|nr:MULTISPECIES: AAA family ATPase [Pelosinus]EIW19590.1 Cobyrinic acid ac-diamide synthase [Pelosinus fermentans B4]OAM96043.1 Cobyrinic acid ac-diamide synthase [Pelosinus fermentans DSM 17108]SDR35705.1 Cellulose biosynthesis protein BcsQ [Pelosinus fermentans]